jgi:DHA1 family tetracycline resistance protein-like MFS transporter
LLGSAVGYYLIGIAGSLLLVFAGRIIGGVTGGNISTAQAYIADVTTRENRAKGMGMFGAMFGLGFILGPALAGILSKYGVHVPFYFAAGLSLANAIALYFILPETVKPGGIEHAGPRRNRFVELVASLREKVFGTVNMVYFLLVAAFSIMTYAFVLFTAYRYGYNAEQNGYLFAFVGLIAIIGQGFLFHKLVSLIGETRLTVVGCLLMAGSLAVFPFLGPSMGGLTALLITCTVLSIGNAFASPSLTSLASKISPENRQGVSMGIMQSAASLARAIGPTVGGLLLTNAFDKVDDVTVTRTFWTASMLMFVAMGAAIYAVRIVREHQPVTT